MRPTTGLLESVQRLRELLIQLMTDDPSWELIKEMTEVPDVPEVDPPGNLSVLLEYMSQHGFDIPDEETVLVCHASIPQHTQFCRAQAELHNCDYDAWIRLLWSIAMRCAL